MGLPWQYTNNFEIFDNETTCIELDVIQRGTIRNLVVSQEEGTQEGFEVDIFTNRDVCPPDTGSVSSSSSAGDTQAEELFKIIPTQSTNGQIISAFDKWWPFVTSGGSTVPSKKLYMRVRPSGANTDRKAFEMKIDFESADL